MAILNEASIIIKNPAPIHNAGINAVNAPACGIKINPKEANKAPTKKYGFLRPNLDQVLSE